MLVRIFIIGWLFLVLTIVFNFFALQLSLHTWYDFFEKSSRGGIVKAFRHTDNRSKLFLFIVYPLFLGSLAFILVNVLGY